MAVRDFKSQRVFIEADLSVGTRVACTTDQANYLRNVLRMPTGAVLLVFNGAHGEWHATLNYDGKRGAILVVGTQTRSQEAGPDLWYVFAPLKRARLDYMVQKAVEMGVSRLKPVLTQHTVAERVNIERMKANVIEAAEQCGVLRLPEVDEPTKLETLLEHWPGERAMVFCDEDAPMASPLASLQKIATGPVAVLVGPEGGFSEDERRMIKGKSFAYAISLGPRIMRADTAAVAALALVNATQGDWR